MAQKPDLGGNQTIALFIIW